MVRSGLARRELPLIHVLLIEDNPSDAFLLENLLESGKDAEYKTHCVKTQSGAVAALNEQIFDVCLLDLTLPDAREFSALIDIQEKAPDMPVLILTGTNDMSLAKRAVRRGAQDYLLKDELEISSVSRSINYALERKRVEKDLFQRANYDALTGISNRESFLNRVNMALARAERSGFGIAILFIDLDRFKPINDMHGHDAGDEALKIVAQRIKAALRAYDTLARFGGDEFAVLLENISSPRDAANVAQKIIKELALHIPYHNYSLEVGASIGIVFSNTPVTIDTLLQHADTAMYHAKKDGGSTYRFYCESMYDEAKSRLRLEEDLRIALEADELRLYYQPYVNQDGKSVIGVEALLRWIHPERGLLSAHEFIAAADAVKIMPDIGKWMYTQLRHDIAMWSAHSLPPMNISINLSVSQMDAPDLLEWLIPITRKEFLDGNRLAVDIPTEALISPSQADFVTIDKISNLGIDLHLDNFGRDSISLAALQAIPFSLIKIDTDLIKNMSDDISGNVLIRAAIILAHNLGMKAGIVGVEEQWQATALKTQSWDIMQGYLIAQPMAAEQLAKWLGKQGSDHIT